MQFLCRPGRTLGDAELARLTAAVREVASTCFDELPPYQVMLGTRSAFSDKAIALAWSPSGQLVGFCSCVLIEVEGVGEVLHLGLTCVRPDHRGSGLTHKLTAKAVRGYMFRRNPFRKVWFSNCAAVLSSLGNVALHFDEVYPSPFGSPVPGDAHLRIALAIDVRHREGIYIREDAVFDANAFVFRGSVPGTVFEKEEHDRRFHHRRPDMNRWYGARMDFGRGDEVLQVGSISLLTAARHFLRRGRRLRSGIAPAAEPAM